LEKNKLLPIPFPVFPVYIEDSLLSPPMKIPIVEGIIDRRILINYRVERSVLRKILPAPFRPVVVDGYGIVGIDLLRLRNMRAKGLPSYLGFNSENAAHRISVEWDHLGTTKRGLYMPRLDTSSLTTTIAGGRVFPGLHHKSRFETEEKQGHYHLKMKNRDGTFINLTARQTKKFPFESIFEDFFQAARFFARDRVAYSPRFKQDIFDGVTLKCKNWKLYPLHVSELTASYFRNSSIYPPGSVFFDHALLMKNIHHEWHAHKELIASRPIRFAGFVL
jgi:uncharacterized protein YqjF (DUF2071 family)